MHVRTITFKELESNPGERILRGLLARDAATVVTALEPPGQIIDPLVGAVAGPDALAALTRTWLARRGAWTAELGPLREMLTPARSLTECVLLLRHRSRRTGVVTLPVAMVADLAPDGRARTARIYHSTLPATAGHRGRSHLLPEGGGLVLPAAVQRLARALLERKADVAVDCFEERGYVRLSTGHRFYGPPGLRVFFDAICESAPQRFSLATATVDETDCAVEYTVIPQDGERIAPQAGLAVFRMGPQEGRLRFVRLYNDLEVPRLPVTFEIGGNWHDADLQVTQDRSGYFRPQHYHWPARA